MTDASWVPGRVGNALELDGSNDEVDLGSAPIVDMGAYERPAGSPCPAYATSISSRLSKGLVRFPSAPACWPRDSSYGVWVEAKM